MPRLTYLRALKNRLATKVLRRLTWESDRLQQRVAGSKCTVGARTVLYPSCKIDNEMLDRSLIRIGHDTQVLSNLQVFPHGGRIVVGNDCYLGEQTRIWSMNSITIGDRVLISHATNIHDHNAHSLSANDRHEHLKTIIASGHPNDLRHVDSAPVFIEDDAWIGFSATILKGVRIGKGAVVGACSVVTKDVAPYSIVVGNPARVVGTSSA